MPDCTNEGHLFLSSTNGVMYPLIMSHGEIPAPEEVNNSAGHPLASSHHFTVELKSEESEGLMRILFPELTPLKDRIKVAINTNRKGQK